jgi:prepilin-type N-terminal cleavage/methylation domain-containing protein
MSLRKGFTLIELLVVISIISLLSSVVLSSLSSARDQGREAAIKSSLRNVIPAAEMFFLNNNGTYNNFCAETAVTDVISSIQSGGGFASCYVYSPIATTDWSLVAYFGGLYHTVNSQGVTIFDEVNLGTLTWDAGITACSSVGKKLPTPSQIRNLYEIKTLMGLALPEGFSSNAYWSSVETTSLNAYRGRVDVGSVVNEAKTNTRAIRCIS